ncbi:glycosyltransferase [Pseudonocardia acaciae]|uniref:glycosyltransferase n=1 Tax=Pseudonocardia acaciae TaxID=551276 RepID=UPI00048AEC69|nr:glycosyltransferase [Pseudonocardia acaciae]
MINAAGVMVPAHNEEARIERCLRSVRAALDRLPRGVRVAVTVVLDRCADRTRCRALEQLRGWPAARILPVHRRPVGTGVGLVRDIGVRDLLRRLRPAPPEQVWLLSTDADTTVPTSWAADQLRHGRDGAHGVAGLADLDDESALEAAARASYHRVVDGRIHRDSHRHVYAANLGVRADAYRHRGGFPARGHGEEHGLWRAMAEAGYRLRQPADLRVLTSARTRGRARGGLADLLRSLRAGAA